MNGVVSLRDNLRKLYAEYGEYMRPLFRFLLGFFFLTVFRNFMCFNDTFAKPAVLLLLSVLCAFFRTGAVSLLVCIYIIANMYTVSYAALLFGTVFFMLVLMLYFGLRPGKGLILSLIPVSFILRVPYICPLIFGLMGGITSVIPCTLGILTWFLLRFFHENAASFTRTSNVEDIAREFLSFIENFLDNKELYVVICAFVVCIFVTYLISRLSIDHAWTIAVIVGTLVMGIILIVGNRTFGIETEAPGMIFGLLAALAAGLIYEFLFFNLDYKASEHLQFEDDEYYYYVKAVPKAWESGRKDRRE